MGLNRTATRVPETGVNEVTAGSRCRPEPDEQSPGTNAQLDAIDAASPEHRLQAAAQIGLPVGEVRDPRGLVDTHGKNAVDQGDGPGVSRHLGPDHLVPVVEESGE